MRRRNEKRLAHMVSIRLGVAGVYPAYYRLLVYSRPEKRRDRKFTGAGSDKRWGVNHGKENYNYKEARSAGRSKGNRAGQHSASCTCRYGKGAENEGAKINTNLLGINAHLIIYIHTSRR